MGSINRFLIGAIALVFLLCAVALIVAIILFVQVNKTIHQQPTQMTLPLASVSGGPLPPRPSATATSSKTTATAAAPVCYFNMKNPAWTVTYRLSNTTTPSLYTLTVQPFISAGLFNGTVSIKLQVTKPTCYIYLHQHNLNLSTLGLQDLRGNSIGILQSFSYEPNQYWVVTLRRAIGPGIYSLSLSFSGSLTENIVGFYRSVYTNKLTGKQSQLATTKFEPTYARKAFPCFDEPNKKANYSIIVVSDPLHPTVISNMPIQNSVLRSDNWKVTTFQTSVRMSTYLVVFVISDFVSALTKSQNGITVKTYAPSDRINQTKYALQVSAQALDYYDQYFGIPYGQSIGKLDLVSIPDFVSGAMENWGAVTFRETNILYDPQVSSAYSQERVTEVVCHELAHMWFGNLVTMDWWDDLWLNEGFATFMAYAKVQPAIKPQWNTDTSFVYYELQDVLPLDSVASSHPIIQPVYHPDDINAAFDSITYGKGSSVIRMLDGYLGPEMFKKGIQSYLAKFQYSNAKTDDLWAILQQVSGKNVKMVMDKWTKQMGFPVITWNSSKGTVTQQRFFSNPKDSNSSSASLQWYVPLSYQTAMGLTNSTLFTPQYSMSLALSSNLIGSWINLNLNEKGYYRVNYDQLTWKALTSQLNTNMIVYSVSDRAELIDDAFNLAGATILDYGIPLTLLRYLKSELQFVPWASAVRNLAYIDKMLRQNAIYPKFSTYISTFSRTALSRLGWNDTSDNNNLKITRGHIISLACGHGDTLCLGNATVMFQKWLQNSSTWLSPNYRKSVYKYGMQTLGGNPSVWNVMWNRYIAASPDTARDYQYALAQTKNTSLLSSYIKLAENKSYIRDQDYFIVMGYISGNPIGTQLVYNYVKTNWNKLVARFSLNDRYFGRFIPTMTSSFNTDQQLNDLESFFAQYPDAGAGVGSRKQAIADIQKNIQWRKVNVPKIVQWLNTNI